MRRLVLLSVTVAVIGLTFAYLLPKIGGYRHAWTLVLGLSASWVGILAACAAFDLATFAPPWQAALPGLRFWPALAVTQASTAASLVAPAGSAVGMAVAYRFLRRRGFSTAETGRAVALTSLWNQLGNVAYPLVALCLLAASGRGSSGLAAAGAVGGCVLAVVLGGGMLAARSERLAYGIGERAARAANVGRRSLRLAPVRWSGRTLEVFRLEAVALLRMRWLALTVSTVVNALATLLTLTACVRALGVPASRISLLELFSAWALSRLVSGIELTPGGFGVFELTLSGSLVGFGGPGPAVVAAVLLYRALTVLPTLAAGLLVIAAAHLRSDAQQAPARSGRREGQGSP